MNSTNKDLTAIIQVHYPGRRRYLGDIINAIHYGSMIPNQIIVWVNGPYYPGVSDDRTWLVRSSKNNLLGRHAAVMLATTPYIFMQDDDLIVGRDTIKDLYEAATVVDHRIVGLRGVLFGPDPDHPYTSGQAAIGPTHPSSILMGGGCVFNKSEVSLRYAEIIENNLHPGRNDDIFISWNHGFVIEATDSNRTISLDEFGEGLSHEPQHMAERDSFVKSMIAGTL